MNLKPPVGCAVWVDYWKTSQKVNKGHDSLGIHFSLTDFNSIICHLFTMHQPPNKLISNETDVLLFMFFEGWTIC